MERYAMCYMTMGLKSQGAFEMSLVFYFVFPY